MSKIGFIKQFIRFCAVTPPMIAIFGGGVYIILGIVLDNTRLKDFGFILNLCGLITLIAWIMVKERYTEKRFNEKFLKTLDES